MIKKILGITTIGAIGVVAGFWLYDDYVKAQIDEILDSNWLGVDCNSICDKLIELSKTKYRLGIDSWNKEKLDLMNELDGADSENDELKDKLCDAEATIEKLKEDLDDAYSEILSLEDEVESLGYMMDAVEAERDLYKSDIDTLQKKNKELQAWQDDYKMFDREDTEIKLPDTNRKSMMESMQEIAKAFREALDEL